MFLNRKKLSKRDLKLLQKANFKLEIKISQIRDRNEHINKNNKQQQSKFTHVTVT